MTSSPGSTAASMAAIIASVAPHETVISASGSRSRPQAAEYFLATALRSCGAPHVVAYWLKPSRNAFAAASRMRGSVLKSGKPWAKFTALAGPVSRRFSRVIWRMTESVKLWVFSERRSVSRVGALQLQVEARTRVAALGLLEAALPPAAHLARPPGPREEVEHVGAAQQADHLAAFDHRNAPDAFADEEACRLVDAGLLRDRDHTRAHDVAGNLALLREHVGLGDDPDHVPLAGHDGGAGDVLGEERLRNLVHRPGPRKGVHLSRHNPFDRDHLARSVATVERSALPPLNTSPVRPFGSLPAR